MVRVPCSHCGISIDIEPMMALSGYDILCKECKSHIEAGKRDAKLAKLLKKSLWQKLKQLIILVILQLLVQ